MSLEEIITSHPEIFGFITFLVGGLLGNRYAIGRDRRKEFNEVADEIALSLIKKKEGAVQKLIWSGPTNDQLENLKRRSSFFKRKSVKRACTQYINAITNLDNQKSGSGGQPFYKNSDKIVR